jgi:ribonuclease P protein component
MRSGRKAVGNSLVMYLKQTNPPETNRVGFVVSKAVGSAVDRNLVKRRLRALSKERLANFGEGQLLVLRALPTSKDASWKELCEDFDSCFSHLTRQN